MVGLGRFVRFVSTPEVLERVTTIESEILQIEDAIVVQSNESLGLRSVSRYLFFSKSLSRYLCLITCDSDNL